MNKLNTLGTVWSSEPTMFLSQTGHCWPPRAVLQSTAPAPCLLDAHADNTYSLFSEETTPQGHGGKWVQSWPSSHGSFSCPILADAPALWDTFSASSPHSHIQPLPVRPVLTLCHTPRTPAERSLPLVMLFTLLYFLSLCLALFLSLDFAVFKTLQSVYCRITAIVCFKFDSCFIQLPSVEAAR